MARNRSDREGVAILAMFVGLVVGSVVSSFLLDRHTATPPPLVEYYACIVHSKHDSAVFSSCGMFYAHDVQVWDLVHLGTIHTFHVREQEILRVDGVPPRPTR